jgi:PD-(D/E)XK nuclease superfamily/Domain of unknown function (DUF2357)
MFIELTLPPEDWETATLSVGNVALPLSLRSIGGKPRIIAEWKPSGPGHYELRLRAHSRSGNAITTIQPGKLTADEFGDLLEDLESRLPISIAIALQQLGGLSGLSLSSARPLSLAEELARVRGAIHGTAKHSGLTRILTDIAKDPFQMLKATTRWVPRERSRRPVAGMLSHALIRPGNLTTDRLPRAIADNRVIHSTDVYENRIARTFLTQVERRLRRLALVVHAHHSAILATEADALLTELQHAGRRAAFLDGVSQLDGPPSRLTMVLLRRPEYQTLLESYLAFQRGLAIRLDHPALDAPLQNLPLLYQLWGTLYVIEALLKVGIELGYRLDHERLTARDVGGVYLRTLPDGVPAIAMTHQSLRKTVRLIPERSYSASRSTMTKWRSVTYTQRPDIAIEIEQVGGESQILIFDPKYKVDGPLDSASDSLKPVKPDIDKMHTYRDAIRDSEDRRSVSLAATLYPGPSVHFDSGIAALSARPSDKAHLSTALMALIRTALA